ncbi:hypothetical protein CRG98_021523 [Punica granatum]|uniref:Uncharacterized protein n=1 Tax=Punica granatum TaxID=22663 RepID=A0A2I0JRI2_PUNGR|nr:hypothetical protein CRG98_021523 [Punica granatum]
MVIPSLGVRDGTVRSRVGPLEGRVWVVFRLTDPDGSNRPVWSNLTRLGTREKTGRFGRLGWLFGEFSTVFGSEFSTVDPDGILRQGQRLPNPNSPPEVTVVVVFRNESRIDQICKKTPQTVRNFNPTGQFSGQNSPRWIPMEF